MIKCNKELVEIRGEKGHILAELANIVHHLHYGCFVDNAEIPEEKSREMIMHAVELGLTPPEEVHKEAEKSKECLRADALKALDELRSILLGKDEE